MSTAIETDPMMTAISVEVSECVLAVDDDNSALGVVVVVETVDIVAIPS